jgi:hypothetical protein
MVAEQGLTVQTGEGEREKSIVKTKPKTQVQATNLGHPPWYFGL